MTLIVIVFFFLSLSILPFLCSNTKLPIIPLSHTDCNDLRHHHHRLQLPNDPYIDEIQHYLNSLATYYLNVDNTSEESNIILRIFDNENHILHDKIDICVVRMSSLQKAIKINNMENKLFETKREMKEMTEKMNQMMIMMEESMITTTAAAAAAAANGGSGNNNIDQIRNEIKHGIKKHRHQQQQEQHQQQQQLQQQQVDDNILNQQRHVIIEFPEINPQEIVIYIQKFLSHKGPQSVGEIGKSLQSTGHLQLKSMIKEKYHGMKRFLERFPDVFVVGNEHPFNPFVYLKNDLSPDELRLIARGNRIVLDELQRVSVNFVLFCNHFQFRFVIQISFHITLVIIIINM
jgi:hypothetical protein